MVMDISMKMPTTQSKDSKGQSDGEKDSEGEGVRWRRLMSTERDGGRAR